MNKAVATALVALAILCTAGIARGAERPAVPIEKALAIAQDSLKERGLSDTLYIHSVQYELSSLMKGHRYWLVIWSEKIPAETPKKKEVGIKVYMDGRATRLIE